MAAGRIDLVIRTFDIALASCNRHDAEKALKALAVLEQSLNGEAFPELASSLLRLYRYCQDLLREGAFTEASEYLDVLHRAWVQVKKGKNGDPFIH